jgi:Zn finger protein HypA/HybF involved in hydrogenase expression
MNLEMKQENFSHCKCQACGYFSKMEYFDPEVVPLEESNIPTVKWTIENNDGLMKLETINYKCPICGSPHVEPYFETELN